MAKHPKIDTVHSPQTLTPLVSCFLGKWVDLRLMVGSFTGITGRRAKYNKDGDCRTPK